MNIPDPRSDVHLHDPPEACSTAELALVMGIAAHVHTLSRKLGVTTKGLRVGFFFKTTGKEEWRVMRFSLDREEPKDNIITGKRP